MAWIAIFAGIGCVVLVIHCWVIPLVRRLFENHAWKTNVDASIEEFKAFTDRMEREISSIEVSIQEILDRLDRDSTLGKNRLQLTVLGLSLKDSMSQMGRANDERS